MSKKKLCATNPIQPEFSLCGDAYDAPETEDDVEPFDFAYEGQTVTCVNCRHVIDTLREQFPRGYKYK